MTCDSLHVGKKFSTQKKLNTQASRNKKTKIKIKISITKMIDLLFTGNKSEKKKKKRDYDQQISQPLPTHGFL